MDGRVESIDLESSKGAYHAPATTTSAKQLIHVSGQVGTTKAGNAPPDYESQIHLALLNLHKVIILAGSSIQDIAKLTFYIVNYDAEQRLHTKHIQKFLRGHRPAMTLVPVPKLAKPEWLIEIEAVVAKPDQRIHAPRSLGPVASKDIVDLAVIGAGLSGLTSARQATRAGLSVLVLEARDRVGGKTWSQSLPGGDGVVDLGAAWINDTNQSRVYALAKEFGVELIEQNTTGNCAFQGFDGKVSSFQYGDLRKLSEDIRTDIARIRDMCEAECQKIDPANPRSEDLDSLTFEAYLRRNGASKEALETASVWTRAMLGQEPSSVSALYFLTYCKAGGGLLTMRSDRKGGGQHLRVREGTQAFAKGLAQTLPSGSLKLSTPVLAVHQPPGKPVQIQTSTGTIFCRRVIVSVPAPVYRTIDFQPALPPAKKLLSESFNYGYYTKVMMEFSKPFWVDRGFCGLSQSFVGPASVVRDTSSPADKKWVLTCFLAGESGRAWSMLSAEQRDTALLKQLGELFTDSRTAQQTFVASVSHEWIAEQYSGWGCPCTSLPPGVLESAGGALCEPVDQVHFVGTETASKWKGYMEGAILSGERGAEEVIKSLSAARL